MLSRQHMCCPASILRDVKTVHNSWNGTERNGSFWNDVFLERNGTDLFGTDLSLERNRTDLFGTDFSLERNGTDRNGSSLSLLGQGNATARESRSHSHGQRYWTEAVPGGM